MKIFSDVELKALLKKYIQHVKDCEGVDFINNGGAMDYSEVKFTKDEWQLLIELAGKPTF